MTEVNFRETCSSNRFVEVVQDLLPKSVFWLKMMAIKAPASRRDAYKKELHIHLKLDRLPSYISAAFY